jgi:serine/threonine-protein kinase RsbT
MHADDPKRPPYSPIVGDLVVFQISHTHDPIFCSLKSMEFAVTAGLSGTALAELGIVVSELVTNVVRYAGTGVLTLRRLVDPRPGLELTVEDHGPGIEDIEAALADGYSQGQTLEQAPPGQKRSLGAGLGAVKRLMSEVAIENRPEGGVKIVACKWVSKR